MVNQPLHTIINNNTIIKTAIPKMCHVTRVIGAALHLMLIYSRQAIVVIMEQVENTIKIRKRGTLKK
jgi:hypothetical protein